MREKNMMTGIRGPRLLQALICVAVLAASGCGGDNDNPKGNQEPSVSGPLPTEFFVGEKTTVFFSILDPDGDPYTVSFDARTETDYSLYDISDRAAVVKVDGGAEFSWTPIAVDVGKYGIMVYARDVNGHRGSDIMDAYVFASKP